MRIGIFGGTFDPVHLGHLIIAEQCREQANLDRVWFIPSARPPHKLDRQLTHFTQRVEMLALAIAGQPTFRINELEKDRPGPSFMADTLTAIHEREPDDELFLIIGSDSLADMPHWHEPGRIADLATFLIAIRPDFQLPARIEERHQLVCMPLIDISSRDIRRRIAAGSSIRFLTPRAIECFIHEKRLYV